MTLTTTQKIAGYIKLLNVQRSLSDQRDTPAYELVKTARAAALDSLTTAEFLLALDLHHLLDETYQDETISFNYTIQCV